MIRKYSIYFASIASILVFGEGLFVHLSFQNLVIRTVVVFCGFYILGNLLGVIIIEALLENQMQKVEKVKENKKNSNV